MVLLGFCSTGVLILLGVCFFLGSVSSRALRLMFGSSEVLILLAFLFFSGGGYGSSGVHVFMRFSFFWAGVVVLLGVWFL